MGVDGKGNIYWTTPELQNLGGYMPGTDMKRPIYYVPGSGYTTK
jgi:hypothetical protein